VCITIITVLVAILLPAIGGVMQMSRGFKCQLGLRSIAFDFTVFADEEVHGPRGDDDVTGQRGPFHLENFVDAQYQIDEFWAWESATSVRLREVGGTELMSCPNVRADLTLLRNRSCVEGGITPPSEVSFGFNMRLHRVRDVQSGPPRSRTVMLTSAILLESKVPLVWDVDGALAAQRNVGPLFTAPQLPGDPSIDTADLWFPAARHRGSVNFAFTDGHVEDSQDALAETDWRWSYIPDQR
jgi:prepilin-type processing-associated H-X9-DG protein